MSRIGKVPLAVPAGVRVTAEAGKLRVVGPKGTLEARTPPGLTFSVDAAAGHVRIGRADDAKERRALHGTWRRLLENMVIGVTTPYERELEIHGVGYQARLQANAKTKKKEVRLQVGFANPVDLTIPDGITVEAPGPTLLKISGCDKAVVGQFAANIRAVRPPEPYNGKGIRYRGERIQKKQGKSFVSSE